MKLFITFLLYMFVVTLGISQEKNIETKSIKVDNLIGFIVNNYSLNESELINTTFLIEVQKHGLSLENEIIIRQSLKLLSKRSAEDDMVSLITYGGFNGIALKQTSTHELKKVLHSINNIKSRVKEFHDEGIDLAYNYANDNFDEKAINRIVMIRSPNNDVSLSNVNAVESTKIRKKNTGTVLITAISLLPELIAVIKN